MIGTSLLFSGSIGGLISPFDTIAPTASYSLRNLTLSYSSDVVLVRRDSDNAFQAFKANEITNGTLSNFLTTLGSTSHAQQLAIDLEPDVSLVCSCDSGSAGVLEAQDVLYIDGLVFAWYDQSGNGYHALQPAAASQPKIWDAITGLVTENGRPALDFDGTDDYLTILNSASDGSNPLNINGDIFCAMILAPTEARSAYVFNNYQGASAPYTGQHILWHQDPAGADVTFETSYDDNSTPSTLVSTSQSLGQYIVTNVRNDGGTNYLYINAVQNVSGADTATGDILSDQDWVIGARAEDATGEIWKGQMQEIILYDSDQSANRSDIESNINDYYDIYP